MGSVTLPSAEGKGELDTSLHTEMKNGSQVCILKDAFYPKLDAIVIAKESSNARKIVENLFMIRLRYSKPRNNSCIIKFLYRYITLYLHTKNRAKSIKC